MSDFDDFLKKKQRVAPAGSDMQSQSPTPIVAAATPGPSAPAPAGKFQIRPSARAFAPPSPNTNLAQCQAVLRCDPSNVWGQLERTLESTYQAFVDACRALGIEATIRRSNFFEYPYSVRFEAWLPAHARDPLVTDRVLATVVFEPKPYHRFQIEYTVTVNNRGREKKWGVFGDLTSADIAAIVRHLVLNEPKPSLRCRIRTAGMGWWESLTSHRNRS